MSESVNKNNSFFSIIVPVYNAERYLEKCITSVLEQSFRDFELILVDDGSKDRSAYICDQHAQKEKRIKIIHQKNTGQTLARKKGVIKSTGKYILFLDSDDWLEKETLEKCHNILIRKSVDILVFGSKEYKKDKVVEIPIDFPQGYYDEKRIESTICPSLLMDENGRFFPRALWGKVFERQVITNNLNKVPGMIRNGEDMCCIISTVLESKSIYIFKDSLYFYRIENVESLSKSGDELALKRCKVMADFFDDIVLKKNPTLRDQYLRLLVQQTYSAVVRTLNEIDCKKCLKLYQELIDNSFCSVAISQAKFSRRAIKLKIKQIILKYELFWFIKCMRI